MSNLNKKGKFFVIEGTDGSGKATQTNFLIKRLRRDGYEVEVADFPQYGKPSAKRVEQYLNGEFGTAQEVGPYKASEFYAEDREAAGPMIRAWLDQGKIVVANRYVSSNMGHQASKIKDPDERDRYLEWLEDLEFVKNNIPRPDMIFFLYVPLHIAQQLIEKKEERNYIKGGKKKDIHELDLEYLKLAEEAYLDLTKRYSWKKIDCISSGSILSIQAINDLLYKEVLSFF